MGTVANTIKGYCSRYEVEDLTIISDTTIEFSGDITNYLHPIEMMQDFKERLDRRKVKRTETTCSGRLFIFI